MIGAIGTLAHVGLIVFFVWLKIAGHINWSWFWVLWPVWLGIAVMLFLLLLAGGVVAAGAVS